jgi:hypothetical protein
MCHTSVGECCYPCSTTPSQYGVSRALFQLQQQREATTSHQGAVSRVGQLCQLSSSELCGTAVNQTSRLAELHKIPHCSTGWVSVMGNMSAYTSECRNVCSCPVLCFRCKCSPVYHTFSVNKTLKTFTVTGCASISILHTLLVLMSISCKCRFVHCREHWQEI